MRSGSNGPERPTDHDAAAIPPRRGWESCRVPSPSPASLMFPQELAKPVGAAACLALLWSVEGLAPMFEGRKDRVRHDLANVALGVFNALVASSVFAGATLAVATWSGERGYGLLHQFSLPVGVRVAAAIVLFDAWQYLWHRLNHRVPILWRFHAVHHSDADLDATTALRFHTGEIVLSSIARLAVLPALGLTIQELLVYETVLLPVILFHHSNVRIGDRHDRWMRVIVVTPRMHWVHHSDWRPETDSNFSSILSVWDRIFGSFRLRRDAGTIRLGLGLPDRESRDLKGILSMPRRLIAARGTPPPGEAGAPADGTGP